MGQGHPSEKYEFVNWDDDIPNINGKIKNGNQTTNQINIYYLLFRQPAMSTNVHQSASVSPSLFLKAIHVQLSSSNSDSAVAPGRMPVSWTHSCQPEMSDIFWR